MTIECRKCALVLLSLCAMLLTRTAAAEDVVLSTPNYKMRINPAGFRYEFERPDGTPYLGAHAQSGLQIGKGDGPVSDVVEARLDHRLNGRSRFIVKTADGISAKVIVTLHDNRAMVAVTPDAE